MLSAVSTVCRTIKKVENVLMKSGEFRSPGRKALEPRDTLIEVVMIDATEQPIERPKKKQRRYYSGKEKRHTQKAQLIENQKTREIIVTAFGNGCTHDFHLFKESRSVMSAHTRSLADSGYLGITKLHENSQIPAKKPELHPLTKEQKPTTTNYQASYFCQECHSLPKNLSHFE